MDGVEDDSKARYLAYLSRLRPLARYLAFTSDVGEAFRPVVHKSLVTGSYGVSWGYVIYDVWRHGNAVAKLPGSNNETVTRAVVHQALFQSIASMALPAFTIHTQVNVSKKLFAKISNGKYIRWGPTLTGLAWIPFLPFLYDHPTEHALKFVFENVWPEKRNSSTD